MNATQLRDQDTSKLNADIEEYYKELWADRTRLVGKLATIRYQGFTEKGSLRFPTAQAIDPIDR